MRSIDRRVLTAIFRDRLLRCWQTSTRFCVIITDVITSRDVILSLLLSFIIIIILLLSFRYRRCAESIKCKLHLNLYTHRRWNLLFGVSAWTVKLAAFFAFIRDTQTHTHTHTTHWNTQLYSKLRLQQTSYWVEQIRWSKAKSCNFPAILS